MEAVWLHLTTPAGWRAALDTGAVAPPSLSESGFVHLSTPDQAHLPAQRLFAGRRDVIALVVDPARLAAPVRLEPGTAGDPASMRFPHLYGPLPMAAVVAVLPWRPEVSAALPSPGDAAARARALAVSLPTRRAVEVRGVPGGFAVTDRAFPHSREDNRLLTGPVDADGVRRSPRSWLRAAAGRTGRRRCCSPDAGPVAEELARRGWEVTPAVVMAHWLGQPGAPRPGAPRAEVVAQAAVHDLWRSSWRRALTGRVPDVDRVVGELVDREHRNDRVLRVVDLAVRERGQVFAAGQLRVDGATAAVEAVLTAPAARGRGHADAVLARALDLARDAGCDLVVLEAAALDWPQRWYARRGFAPVDRIWDVARR